MNLDVNDVYRLRGNYFSVVFKQGERQEGRIGVKKSDLLKLLTNSLGSLFDKAIIVPESRKVGRITKYVVGAGS